MFNTNDILTRLQNGESVDAIAAEFTKSLNDAETKFRENATKIQKRKEFKSAMENLLVFFRKYYGDNPILQKEVDLDDADYDKMLTEIEAYLSLGEVFGGLALNVEEDKDVPASSAEDILKSWINKI